MRHQRPTRRDFLTTSATVGAGMLIVPGLLADGRAWSPFGWQAGHRGWGEVDAILARIAPPVFPDRVFQVTKYGAVGDGVRDCTAAFTAAIGACAAAGGGRVLVPEGRFLAGAIHLKSRVELHLSERATIVFSRDPRHYLPVVFSRWEGVELMNYSPLIYAFEQRDVAVTGKGTLDGQASDEYWWPWKSSKPESGKPSQLPARTRLIEMGARGVPVGERVFGVDSFLRPNFIQPYRCQNVLIEGVTIVNSPMWEIHPVLCTNVTVRNVAINSHGPNNDGCDPESCRDVLIEGCTFDTGDDCIALKSGRNEDGRRLSVPTENVIVRNCVMKDGHGGVVIGSEVSGGARNIFAEKCRMDSPIQPRPAGVSGGPCRAPSPESRVPSPDLAFLVRPFPRGVLGVEERRGPRPVPAVVDPPLVLNAGHVVADDTVAAREDRAVGADLVEPRPDRRGGRAFHHDAVEPARQRGVRTVLDPDSPDDDLA
jgi:hypothetical protein